MQTLGREGTHDSPAHDSVRERYFEFCLLLKRLCIYRDAPLAPKILNDMIVINILWSEHIMIRNGLTQVASPDRYQQKLFELASVEITGSPEGLTLPKLAR
jgi:hypothetical protein